MRGSKAKRLRKLGIEKPGRKHGGSGRREYRETIKTIDANRNELHSLTVQALKFNNKYIDK